MRERSRPRHGYLYNNLLIAMVAVFQIPTLVFFLAKVRLVTAPFLWRPKHDAPAARGSDVKLPLVAAATILKFRR